MEPTPELKALADRFSNDLMTLGVANINERALLCVALITNAKELRAALLPFERAAEFSPAVREAVERGKANVERLRATDEALAQRIGADKPAYAAKLTLRERIVAWLGRRLWP